MSDRAPVVSALLSCATDEVVCVDRFLEDDAVCALARELLTGDTRRLVLRGNCIGDRGARALTELLRASRSLRQLELNWNQISCWGAKEIAGTLKLNLTLETLDLRNNHIKDEGAMALAAVLRVNETLQELDLRWNQITDEGALAFKDTLATRKSPLVIHLSGNLLSQRVQSVVQEWARRLAGRAAEEDEYGYEAPAISADLISELEGRNSLVERDSRQTREELAALQEACGAAQAQLDSSALRVAELELQAGRDKFTEAQLREGLRAAKTRVGELSEERRLLTDMWERERGETLERVREVVAEQEARILLLVSERDALLARVRREGEERGRLDEQLGVLQQQLAGAGARHEEEARRLRGELAELAASALLQRAELLRARASQEFAERGLSVKSAELEALRETGGACLMCCSCPRHVCRARAAGGPPRRGGLARAPARGDGCAERGRGRRRCEAASGGRRAVRAAQRCGECAH